MPEPAKVVGIGSCGVDYFAIVPRLLGPEEKINADRLEIHAGGVTGGKRITAGRAKSPPRRDPWQEDLGEPQAERDRPCHPCRALASPSHARKLRSRRRGRSR